MITVEYKQFLGKAIEHFLHTQNVFSILANYVRNPYEICFVDLSHRALIWQSDVLQSTSAVTHVFNNIYLETTM